MAVKNNFVFLTVTALFIIASALMAHGAVQRVAFSFANGGSAVSNMTFFVIFPEGVIPVNLKQGMIWNAPVKTLTIAIPKADPYQTIDIKLDIDGPPGTHKLVGQLLGQWSQAGQSFQSDPIALQTAIAGQTSERTIERIRSDPRLIAAAQNVILPAAVALEVAGGGALASSLVASNASVAVKIVESLRFVQFLSFGFFRLKKQKPWGRIYNQITGKPIKSATVRVFEATFQKLKDTQFTDADGRFGFLVSPGTYYITVSKAGFHEYKGQLITVKDSAEALDLNIPLVSESSASIKAKSVLSLLIKILNYLNPYILALGTLASIAVVILLPTAFNIIVSAIYVLLDIAKFALSRRTLKSFGKVVDMTTKQPVTLAIIRIFDAERNWLLTSRVTDTEGRFRFLVTPGNYYISCAREGYKPYISQPLAISKASAVSWDINLEKVPSVSSGQATSGPAVPLSPTSSVPSSQGV